MYPGLHLGFFFKGGQNSRSGIPGEANSVCQSHTINLKGGQTSSKGGANAPPRPPPKCSPGTMNSILTKYCQESTPGTVIHEIFSDKISGVIFSQVSIISMVVFNRAYVC